MVVCVVYAYNLTIKCYHKLDVIQIIAYLYIRCDKLNSFGKCIFNHKKIPVLKLLSPRYNKHDINYCSIHVISTVTQTRMW